VSPESAAAAVELRDIRGPSVLGGGWRRFWRLSWRMARTDFVLRYHGSVLGYAWSLMNPLLLFGVLYLAFTEVLRFGDQIDYFPALLLLNLMLFQFFSEVTSRSVISIVTSENLVRKMEFPRLAVPISLVLAGTLTLLLDLVVVFGYVIASGVPVRPTWLLFPVLLLVLYALTVGFSLLLSSLYVRYRDVAQVWIVATQALLYSSAVIFPLDFIPESLRSVLALNPLVWVFTQTRAWIIDPNAPSFIDVMETPTTLVGAAFVFVGVIALGVWTFIREAPRAAEEL
jgi:ABC-2 type transport system permease protein